MHVSNESRLKGQSVKGGMGGRRSRYYFILLTSIAVLSCRVLSIDERQRRFKWTASIDRATGIATSREISRVPLACPLHRAISSGGEAAKLAKDLFGGYPSWLAVWPVSQGCLRAIPITGETKNYHKTIALRDPIFGKTVLLFGPGRFSVRGRRRRVGPKTTEYTMTLPLVGGFLARLSPEGTYGSLLFTLISEKRDNGDSFFVLDTAIADYRPALAGSTLPISRVGAGIYRSSQSLLHAYVMWRFHHYCYNASQF
jgi:hypothetical protein